MSDIDLRQDVDIAKLRWPTEEECQDEAGLGRNRSYEDLRGLSFSDVAKIVSSENTFIQRIRNGEAYEDVEEELHDDMGVVYFQSLFSLEPGVASSVTAISALGCVPFNSCNGGEFGGNHLETMPIVGFFARAEDIPRLLEAATECAVGLVNDHAGMGAVVLFAERCENLQRFAIYLAEKYG